MDCLHVTRSQSASPSRGVRRELERSNSRERFNEGKRKTKAAVSRPPLVNSFVNRLRQLQRAVSDRWHFLAVAVGDLARLLVEEAHHVQALRHFGERDDRLHF